MSALYQVTVTDDEGGVYQQHEIAADDAQAQARAEEFAVGLDIGDASVVESVEVEKVNTPGELGNAQLECERCGAARPHRWCAICKMWGCKKCGACWGNPNPTKGGVCFVVAEDPAAVAEPMRLGVVFEYAKAGGVRITVTSQGPAGYGKNLLSTYAANEADAVRSMAAAMPNIAAYVAELGEEADR